LGTGFCGTEWIDVNLAAFEFGAAEIDGGINRVFDFHHFDEAESAGFAGEFVGYHQRAGDPADFREERPQIIARN
jgi:hypothetical protein